MKKLLIILVLSLFGAYANAQYLSSIVREDGGTVTLWVQKGFTPWGYWESESNRELCGWGEFRAQIEILNPQHAANNFRVIPTDPVSGLFQVPLVCTGFVSDPVISEPESSGSGEAILNENQVNVDEVRVALEETGLVLSDTETLGEVLGTVQEGIAEVGDSLQEVQASVDANRMLLEELVAPERADLNIFPLLPWWLDLLILLIIVLGAFLLGGVLARRSSTKKLDKRSECIKELEAEVSFQTGEAERLREENKSLRTDTVDKVPYRDHDTGVEIDVLVKPVDDGRPGEWVMIVDRNTRPINVSPLKKKNVKRYLDSSKHKSVLEAVLKDAAARRTGAWQPVAK